MIYLMTQIFFCLLIAFLLGLLLGYLLGGGNEGKGIKPNTGPIDPQNLTKTYAPPPAPAKTLSAPPPIPVSETRSATSRAVQNSTTTAKAQSTTQFLGRSQDSGEIDSSVDLGGKGYEIETLEGVGPKTGKALRDAGISTVEHLLRRAHTPAQREELAKIVAVRPKMIDGWASMCDLLRIEGVDHQAAELMNASGIRTVADLAAVNVIAFVERMHEVNTAGKRSIAPQVPSGEQVVEWIGRANQMKSLVRF